MSPLPENLKRRIIPLRSSAALSTEEGYVWSRMGSGISLKELFSLCPWAETEAWKYIESLIQKKSAVWEDQAVENSMSQPALKRQKALENEKPQTEKITEELPQEVKDQLQMDQFEMATRDLGLEFRTDILLRLHKAPEQSPYEILGVRKTASQEQIKLKYVELSRKFHPDRFFRKELGIYKRKLEKLFTHIQLAYQDLKNPYDREVLDRKLKTKDSNEKPTVKLAGKKLDPQLEKIGKAEHYYRQGIEARKQSDYAAAFNAFNLACQFNPNKEIYSKALEEVQPFVQMGRAKEYVEQAQHALDIGLFNDALTSAELAAKADPESGEAAYIAAKCIVELGLDDRMDDAFHFLRRAKTKMSMDPEPCVLLGRLYQARRDKDRARHEYEAALKRSPEHPHAKKLLSKLNS